MYTLQKVFRRARIFTSTGSSVRQTCGIGPREPAQKLVSANRRSDEGHAHHSLSSKDLCISNGRPWRASIRIAEATKAVVTQQCHCCCPCHFAIAVGLCVHAVLYALVRVESKPGLGSLEDHPWTLGPWVYRTGVGTGWFTKVPSHPRYPCPGRSTIRRRTLPHRSHDCNGDRVDILHPSHVESIMVYNALNGA